jgi:hypothetical protein
MKLIYFPHKIFLYSSLIILILLILPFYDLEFKYYLSTYFFTFICFFTAFLGLKFGGNSFIKEPVIKNILSLEKYNLLISILIKISIIGIIATVYEWFFIRGLSFTFDITSNYIKWTGSKTSIVSVIASITNTFCIFLIPVYLQKNYYYKDRKYLKICIFLLLIYLILIITVGSRIQLISSLLIQIFTYSFYYRLNKLIILIFPILVIFFSGYYFNLKIGGYGSDLLNSLYFSGYVFTISPMIDMSELYDLNFFTTSLLHIYMYLIHGTYEFMYMIENSTIYYDFGKNLLWLPIKFFNFISPIIDTRSFDNYRSGIYQTFAGTFFRDFKFFSPIFIFIIFFIISVPFKKLNEGDELWLFPVITLNLCLLYCPIFNVFSSGPIGYYIATSLFIKLITSMVKKYNE